MDTAQRPSWWKVGVLGVGAFVAALIFYVLGIGPAAYWQGRNMTITRSGEITTLRLAPLSEAFTPLVKLANGTVFEAPLREYQRWWQEKGMTDRLERDNIEFIQR